MKQQETKENSEKKFRQPAKISENSKLQAVIDWLRTFLIVLTVGILLTIFVIQRNIIEGPSMEPTLYTNDQIFVEKISKYFKVERGDIVTIENTDLFNPETLLIKRVVGMPGEHIEIKENHVYINGEQLDEPYLDKQVITYADPQSDFQSLILADDEFFVLGDNRPVSKDSRKIGPIKKDQILGKLLFKFYPFNEMGVPR